MFAVCSLDPYHICPGWQREAVSTLAARSIGGDIILKIGKKMLSALISCALATGGAVPALAAPLPGDPAPAVSTGVPVPISAPVENAQVPDDAPTTSAPDADIGVMPIGDEMPEDAPIAPAPSASDGATDPDADALVPDDAIIAPTLDAKDTVAPALEPTAASNFEYSVDAAGTIEITRYVGTGIANIVVPSEIDGKPVTKIGEQAFVRTYPISLPDVQPLLEESVVSSQEAAPAVGSQEAATAVPLQEAAPPVVPPEATTVVSSQEAAAAASSQEGTTTDVPMIRMDIQSVVFPDSVMQIGKEALRMNVGLQSVTLPSSLTEISEGLFRGCAALSTVTLPQTVTTIGGDAFDGCVGLAELALPAGVTQIGDRAFAACASLKKMDLPQGLTELSEDLFSACATLETVTIPASVQQMEDRAFAACTMLNNITLPAGITQISDGLFSACTSLAAISIPNGVQKIGAEAFGGCVSLAQVDLPVSVTEIDRLAFGGCPSLLKVNYGGSRAQYDAIAIEGKELGRGYCALVGADITYQNTQTVADPNLPEGVEIVAGSPVYTEVQDGRVLLMGYDSVAKSAMPTAQTLIDQFMLPEGMHAVVKYADGLPGIPNGIISTGDVLCIASIDDAEAANPVFQGTVVVMGDVVGDGAMSLSQLIRMAQAYTGRLPLEGVYLAAGDFAGTGRIDLLDVVREAELLLRAM